MRVLLSIKPDFAAKIFGGSKKYEYRRTIFKRGDVSTVVVYATNPIGCVIGEFEIGQILHDEPEQLWTKTCIHAGMTRERFMEYFANQTKGYAIEIKKVRKYEAPLSLSDLMLSWPPQSFRYLYMHPLDYLDNTVESSLSASQPITTLKQLSHVSKV